MNLIPVNDLKRLSSTRLNEFNVAAAEVIKSGYWINGPQCAQFCGEFARYLGAKDCVGVANGTDALEIAIKVLVEKRSQNEKYSPSNAEIVTVGNAGGYTTTACLSAGYRPVFADIDAETLLIDIGSAVAATNRHTAVVVATHLYGGLVDVPALRKALDAAGWADVLILEDCAQAHGVSGSFGRAGALGDMATYSFYPTKNLGGIGDGGAIVTNDPDLATAARTLSQYGWTQKYRIGVSGGRNSRLDELQAAFLRVALPSLDQDNARRVAILDAYCDAAKAAHVRVPRSRSGTVAHLAVVATPSREELRAHMLRHGVATDVHYPVLDVEQEGWTTQLECAGDTLPNSRVMTGQILTLPCFPAMTDAEVSRVCQALASFRS